ncbi:MAG: TetR/AcrR family transcriptional regulator [Candidatus Thorarchaeota archaeon]|jgi:AcrR family transcriptional regulator
MNKKQAASPKAIRLERVRRQRRQAIIDVARKFFIEYGYDEAMVDKIALEAGYTKVTIYNYFQSKDDLFVAVVAEVYEKLFETMDTHLKHEDVTYELRSMGEAYVIFFEKHPQDAFLFEIGRLSVVTSIIRSKEVNNEILSESEREFSKQMGVLEELMTEVIIETMRSSGVQDKVDPHSVIMVLSTFAQAIRTLVTRGSMNDTPDETTNEYLNVFFTIIDKGLRHYDD